MALTSRIAVTLTAALTNALDLVTPGAPLVRKQTYDLASGVGANQADKVFSDTRTIAPSAGDNLDLAGGSLLDALGVTLAFAKIKALLIVAAAGNTNNIGVGGDPASILFFGAAADYAVVKPGGTLLLVAPNDAGYSVTPTTSDILWVFNAAAGTSVTYDIVIIGTSS